MLGTRKAFGPMFQAQRWAEKKGLTLGEDPTNDPRVRALIGAELERCGAVHEAFERPRELALIRQDFTTENGLLTPTLKLKRRAVMARDGAIIEGLYAPSGRDAIPAPPAA